MKRFITVLSIGMWSLSASWAQLRPMNEAGVTMSQVYSIVRDVDAAKKFWTLMGGTPIKVDGTDVMKFPGVLVFLAHGEPSANNTGTALDHVGFWVTDGPAMVAKLRAAGVKTDPDAGVRKPGVKNVGYVYTADDLKVEVMEDPDQTATAFDHLHGFLLPADAQAWYAKMFGYRADPRSSWPGDEPACGHPNFVWEACPYDAANPRTGYRPCRIRG